MASNDYYVIVYRVLTYLYNQLKAGKPIDTEKLTASWLGIPETYWEYILETLSEEGYIRNMAYEEDMLGKHLAKDISISPAGISFLHENSTIAKVKNAIQGLTDIVGNIPGL